MSLGTSSKDLITWEQEPPIEGVPGGECPSHLKIGDTYYIVSNDYGYSHADSIEGPFERAKLPNGIVIDELDGLQTAAKTIWDGKRHVWFGGSKGIYHYDGAKVRHLFEENEKNGLSMKELGKVVVKGV